MWFNYLVLLTALTISGVAAYYSIIGLTAIFAAAFWPIVIMGSVLEAGKLVTSVWLKKYWDQANWQLKTYLTSAVVILMLVTSMGIFGFLSKAHMDQGVPTGDIAAQVNLFDEKIKTQRDNIESNRKALAQMDATVDQTIGRSNTEQGVTNAANLRRSQQRERGALQNEIAVAQKAIAKLNEERAPIASQLRKVEAEVGPIKYIAALVYGDNPDQNILERAVRWVIIILVLVFDPLAVALILAANSSMRWRDQKPSRRAEPDTEPQIDNTAAEVNEILANINPIEPDIDEAMRSAKEVESQNKLQAKLEQLVDGLTANEKELSQLSESLTEVVTAKDQILAEMAAKLAETSNDQHRINNQLAASENAHNRAITEKQEQVKVLQDRIAELEQAVVLLADTPAVLESEPVNADFGNRFPDNPAKADMFVRTDSLPSKVFKFNGNQWIEVDRSFTNTYTRHLLQRLDDGEVTYDQLTSHEQDQLKKPVAR